MIKNHDLDHEHDHEQVVIRKHGVYELGDGLDHVIACHQHFGQLPRSGPVFGGRNRFFIYSKSSDTTVYRFENKKVRRSVT